MKTGERWVHKQNKRIVVIVADRDVWIDFRYIPGFGGSALWKRRVTPPQTLSIADFEHFFKPAPA